MPWRARKAKLGRVSESATSFAAQPAVCGIIGRFVTMPDFDQFMRALFLVALLLYLIPAVFRVTRARAWSQRGAVLTLSLAMAVAVIASLLWFLH